VSHALLFSYPDGGILMGVGSSEADPSKEVFEIRMARLSRSASIIDETSDGLDDCLVDREHKWEPGHGHPLSDVAPGRADSMRVRDGFTLDRPKTDS
jgi:hypothetical protein